MSIYEVELSDHLSEKEVVFHQIQGTRSLWDKFVLKFGPINNLVLLNLIQFFFFV